MQKDLVEERGWLSQEDYTEGLAFSQLSPGPLAAQLAMYLGWVRYGNWGATLACTFFILPSFFMVLGIAALYLHFGSLSSIQSIFYGVGAAVVAILARSAYKLTRTTLKTDYLLWVLFAVSALATAWTKSEIIWLFLLCGFIAMIVKTRLRSAVPAAFPAGLAWLTTDRKSTRLNSSHQIISYAVFCLKKKNEVVHGHPGAHSGLANVGFVKHIPAFDGGVERLHGPDASLNGLFRRIARQHPERRHATT